MHLLDLTLARAGDVILACTPGDIGGAEKEVASSRAYPLATAGVDRSQLKFALGLLIQHPDALARWLDR